MIQQTKTPTETSISTKRPMIALIYGLSHFVVNWTYPDNKTSMKHLGSTLEWCACIYNALKSKKVKWSFTSGTLITVHWISLVSIVLSTCFLSPFSVSWADIRYPVRTTCLKRRPNLYGRSVGRSTYLLRSTVHKLRIKIFIAVVAAILTTAMKMQHV